jgi:hypothetical protein
MCKGFQQPVSDFQPEKRFARNPGNYFTYPANEVADNAIPVRDPKDTAGPAAGARLH